MNATRVSIGAGLRLGMILTLMVLMVMCFRPANGSEVVITVKGEINGGRDDFGTFGMGRTMPMGTPYTLVFRFDDTKGKAIPGACPNSGSRIVGIGQSSPGTALLTINGKSYEFGRRPDARSRAWRSIATVCSDSEIGMAVEEGHYSLASGVNIKIVPNPGQRSLTQDRDWRGSLSVSKFYARNGDNAFAINRPGNYGAQTMSYLSVSSVTVGGSSGRAAMIEAPSFIQKAAFSETRESNPVAQDDVRIYVLSADGGHRVATYTADGNRTEPTIQLGWWYCTGLAVDEAGKIYVSKNWASDQVTSYQPDGFPTSPVLNVGSVSGIAVGNSGKVYVLTEDGGKAVVRTFTLDGNETTPTIKTGLNNANALAAGDGKLYVASQDNVVKTYDANGRPLATIKAGLNSPRAIAVGLHGRIYVANSRAVSTYLANGEGTLPTIRHVNSATGELDGPTALAVDSDGRVYVGYASGTVAIYDADGKPISEFKARPGIWGVAVH